MIFGPPSPSNLDSLHEDQIQVADLIPNNK